MRRPEGPTARVLQFAASQPGTVITWSEAQHAYAQGVVPVWTPSIRGMQVRGAAYRHKMSISNVLKKHFERVEGTRGMYVLKSTISNPDWEEDMVAMQAFHNLYGSDEFGMSTAEAAQLWFIADIPTLAFSRMSDIGSD